MDKFCVLASTCESLSTGARALLALSPNVVAVIATKAHDGVTPVDMPTILDAVSRHPNVRAFVAHTRSSNDFSLRFSMSMPTPPPARAGLG